MPSDPLKEPKNPSPHCKPVKVLGHTNLPFFIPTGLTALHYKHKGSSTPTKTRKTSNRQIQYNVENFDKIHASSASVRN